MNFVRQEYSNQSAVSTGQVVILISPIFIITSPLHVVVIAIYKQNIVETKAAKMSRELFLRRIFLAGVDAVRPQTIFRCNELVQVVNNQTIQVNTPASSITIDLPVRTHVIGFGKGVFGLAVEMERILGHHLMSGQINVPVSVSLTHQILSAF